MKTSVKTPMEKAQPPKAILNSSIKERLSPGRPVFSSNIRWAGRLCLFSIACAASVITARGQATFTWDGGGTSSNWSDPNNWSGFQSPSGNPQIHFGGTIDLTPNNDLSFTGSGAVSSITFDAGAGAFTLSGNGIALSGGITNNSSNAQTVNMAVQLVGSQTWSAARGDMTFGSAIDLNGSVLTTAGSHNLTFNSPIVDSSGGGSFVQNGAGDTFLNGANTFTGSTTVNAGALILQGSLASAQTTVNSAGILTGNGTIGGNLTNNGIVAPLSFFSNGLSSAALAALASGAASTTVAQLPPANLTLTVKGNYTQNTGTLIIAFAGATSNAYTSLNVAGQANLNGTLRLIQVNGGTVAAGQIVPILTATGGVTGKFSLVQNASLLKATVVYEPNSVDLESTATTTTTTTTTTQTKSPSSIYNEVFGFPGLTTNDLQTAKLLDGVSNDPFAANLFKVLRQATLGQLVREIELIDPGQLSALSNIGSALSNQTILSLTQRFEALQGLPITPGPGGPAGPDGKGGKEVMPPPAANDRWGSFVTGSGDFERVDDTSASRGFNMGAGGVTFGIDYRFTDHFVAGLFGSYTNTGIDIANGGRVNVNTGKWGLYGTYFDGGFYVNAAAEGGYSAYENHRSALGGTARSDTDGGDANLLFAPGYNWTMGGLTFGPTTRFQYSYQSTGGFTESGSLAPMNVGAQHTESIVSAVGMKASYDWKIGGAIIRPELRLEWEHEYGDTVTGIDAQLAGGASNAFRFTTPGIGRDDLHLGAGCAVVFNDRITAYAYYDGQFFRANYDSSTVTGGFRVSF